MKKWIAGIAGILLAVTLAGCSSDNATVASMKGAKITKDQFYEEMKTGTQGGEATLRNMIVTKALDQQYGKKVSDKEVNSQFNKVKKQYGASFAPALQQQGMTEKSFKDQIKTSLLSEAALKDQKKITKKQLDEAWKNYTPKVTVQHILVAEKDKAKAEEIIASLKKDNSEKNFAALAKKYSTDTGTKNDGGKLPAFDNTDTQLDADFKKAALALKQDTFSQTPVKTQFGYHVIRSIKNPGKGTMADHKKELQDQIYSTMQSDSTTMQNVIKKVLTKAKPTIKDKDLQGALSAYGVNESSSSSAKKSSSKK